MIQMTISRKSKGFTLIEILIVVAIIGVLAAIGIPSYQDSVRKSKRADGKSGLVDAASRLEQYYLDNKSYTKDMNELGYNALTGVDTPDKRYKMSVDANPCGNIAACYTVTAIPQGDQINDSCGTLTLNSSGIKTPSECW